MHTEETKKLLKRFLEVWEEWQNIKSNYPRKSDNLKREVTNFYTETDNFKEISFKKSDHDFTELVKDGFLESGVDKYKLSGDKIIPLVFEILEERIRELPEQSKDFSKRVARIIRDMYKLNSDDDYSSIFLIHLHNYAKIDILELATKAINTEENGIFALYHELCEAFPFLELEISEALCNNLRAIKVAVANDLTNGIIFTSIKNYAKLNISLAEAIWEYVNKQEKEEWAFLLNNLILGIGEKDFEEAYKKADSLLNSHIQSYQEAGIISLGFLDYEGEPSKFLDKTVRNLASLVKQNDPELNRALARAYGNLQKWRKKTLRNLKELSKSSVPKVQHGVAEALFHCRSEVTGNDQLKEALLNLSNVRTNQSGTVRSIDLTISNFVNSNTDLVINFLEQWQRNRNENEVQSEQSIVNLFNSTFSKLFRNHKEQIEVLLTRWLNSEHNSLLLECRFIVREYRHKCRDIFSIFELSTSVLDKLSPKDYYYIAKKILGYIFEGKDQCSLVFSLLRSNKANKEVKDFISEIFRDRISYNYPGLTKEFLEIKVEDGNEVQKKMAGDLLTYLENKNESRRSLSYLNELQVSGEKRRKALKIRGKYYNKIYEESRKKSIFANVVTNISLKYGNKSITEWDQVIQPPSALGKLSTSVELPRGELIDPIGEQMLRIQFQQETKK